VLCLQETKQADAKYPNDVFETMGYESAHHGDGRWNGVALLSRVGLSDVVRGFDSAEEAHGCRIVAATCGGVRVHSVYVPNGRSLDNEFYGFKLEWLSQLRTMLDETCPPGTSVAVGGDFNVAPLDSDVWDPAAFEGMTHVSEPERAALQRVMDWGLDDVFTRFNAPGTFSWWDYRGGDFHLGRGVRMDLILVSPDLAERATGSFVDREARKTNDAGKPSDHAPVVVDLRDS
jgi:exodeoxyribonuclease-3